MNKLWVNVKMFNFSSIVCLLLRVKAAASRWDCQEFLPSLSVILPIANSNKAVCKMFIFLWSCIRGFSYLSWKTIEYRSCNFSRCKCTIKTTWQVWYLPCISFHGLLWVERVQQRTMNYFSTMRKCGCFRTKKCCWDH